MTPIEIFSEIYTHKLKGVMFHAECASLYDFMGLRGYKRCHEYQSLSEFCQAISVSRYAINHLNQMLIDNPHQIQKITPANWKTATRFDVGDNDRKTMIRDIYKKWRDWETITKQYLSKKYKELFDAGNIPCSLKVQSMLSDVDSELKELERTYIKLNAVNYNIEYIVSIQDMIHEEYEKKEKEIGIEFN